MSSKLTGLDRSHLLNLSHSLYVKARLSKPARLQTHTYYDIGLCAGRMLYQQCIWMQCKLCMSAVSSHFSHSLSSSLCLSWPD